MLLLTLCFHLSVEGEIIPEYVGNDFVGEQYYYFGDEKVALEYCPHEILMLDFTEPKNKSRRQDMLQQHPELEFKLHIDAADVDMNVYTIKGKNNCSASLNPNYKVFPIYINEVGSKIAPNGMIDVKLKKEADFEILAQLIDNFKCKYIGRSKYDPLWCEISITKDTTLTPIEIANQLHDTNLFTLATPGLIILYPHEISYDERALEQWGLYNASYMGTTCPQAKHGAMLRAGALR